MNRHLLAATMLTAALALGGAVLPSAVPSALAQGATTGEAREFTQRHIVVARDVVRLSGMSRSFQAVIPQFQEAILRQYAGSSAQMVPVIQEILAELRPEMELQERAMMNRAARVMAERLTEEELDEIAVFFASDAGRRYVETQPAVLDGVIGEMQIWSEELAEYLDIRVTAKLIERGAGDDAPITMPLPGVTPQR